MLLTTIVENSSILKVVTFLQKSLYPQILLFGKYHIGIYAPRDVF